MGTSTAAFERNILSIRFIHSKLRYSSAPDTVRKFASIKSNLGAFYNSLEADSDKYVSDTESDVDEIRRRRPLYSIEPIKIIMTKSSFDLKTKTSMYPP